MAASFPVAFLNLGLPEIVVICFVAALLLGPTGAKTIRSLARGILDFKKGVDDTKSEIVRDLKSAVLGPDKKKKSDPPRG